MPKNGFPPGSEIRIKTDPGRRGTVTNADPRPQADYLKYRIQFPEGKVWVPEHELELVDSDQTDPIALIKNGRYGRPEDLRRSLTHIQLSGRLANLVYSMDATNTDFYAYQYKPVLSLLESPTNGLLIADEVGLGKTIEAGLIWTELRARFDARRLLIICPAMLREKWQSELSRRFGVDAEICDARELLKVLKTEKQRTPERKGYICSLQGIRPTKVWPDTEEKSETPQAELAAYLEAMELEEDLIDLTVIDEAHYLRNPESQTARLGALIGGVSDHLILLSATPINLRSEDLFHLLKLIDPDTFSDSKMFPQVLAANEPIQAAHRHALDARSTAKDIQHALHAAKEHDVLKGSSQLRRLVDSNIETQASDEAGRIELADQISRINLLSNVVTRTRRAEVTELRVLREAVPQFIELDEEGPEQHFYDLVTKEILNYAASRGIGTGFLLATPQRQVSSSMYAAAKSWQINKELDQTEVYEDLGLIAKDGDVKEETSSPLIEHLRQTVLPYIDHNELRRRDTKYQKLVQVLSNFFEQHPDEKVVLFTYFRGTVDYLEERLAEDGISSMTLKGGQAQDKQKTIDSFEGKADTRVLVSTEVASEGVDLQFSRFLINYDLPWNPMRVEQRIGRLDRIGQKADKIQIWNLFHKNTIDERIYTRLMDRIGVFERALGGMEAVLGDKISELTADLLARPLTPQQQEKRIKQTALAVERIRKDQDELEKQASHLIAHSSYILRQVQAAHDFKRRITSEDLVNYVKDYLERFCIGHVFQATGNDSLSFEIKLPPSATARLETFLRTNALIGQTRLATGEKVSCIFKNKVRLLGEKKEVISQFHPFVRFIASEITASEEQFYPLSALVIPRRNLEIEKGHYVFVVDRWSFEGLKTEEVLKISAVRLKDLSPLDLQVSWELVNAGRMQGEPWNSVASDLSSHPVLDAVDKAELVLDEAYQQETIRRASENEDRVSFQKLSAKRGRDRVLQTNQRILENHKAAGRLKMIAPTEGKIKKAHERFDHRIAQIEQRSKLTHSRTQTCMGAINVV